MLVYVIIEGAYSHQNVVGVYTHKDLAERCKELYVEENCRMEEYELDKEYPIPPGNRVFCVYMQKDGNSPRQSFDHHPITECSVNQVGVENLQSVEAHKDGEQIHWGENARRFTLIAIDEQHAVKIANERRIQLIAERRWL